MQVPRLVLHIGTAKTGSTAVQSALHRHRDELLAAGIAYLHGDGHQSSRDLAAACVGPGGDDDLLDELGVSTPEQRQEFLDAVRSRLADGVAALPAEVHTIVLSSEHFHSRLVAPSMVGRLAEIVRPLAESVQVVCYLRPQTDLIASFYSTYLRNGGCETLDDVADRVLRVGHPYADYEALLSLWSAEFGAAAVRPRVFGEFVGGTLMSDFSSVIGAPDGLLQPSGTENPSISVIGQVLLLAINRAVASGATDQGLVDARARIAATFVGAGHRWSSDVAAARQAPFDAGNEAVRRRWFPNRAVLFAAPDGAPSAPMIGPDQIEVLVDLFARTAPPPAERPVEARSGRWRHRLRR